MTNALQAGSHSCLFPPGRRKGRVEKIKWRMLGLLFILGCLPFMGFAQLPTISGISPALGTTIPGTVVTITGSNFNTSIANNIVQFGAVKGTVTAATATSLTVTTPVGATYAPVTVLNTSSGLTGTSVKPFMPTFVGKGSLTNNDFLPPVGYLTGSSAFAPAIGDLDNDGKPDLVTVNNAGNSVSVFRNISSSGSITASSFAGKVDYASGGDSPDFIAIGDLDGDNRLDIIITNRNSSSVSVFRNNSSAPGSISFQSQVSFATGLNPNCVAIGDLDKDGRQDLVVSNNGASTISVLRNLSSSGSINFAAQFTVATNSSPMSVAIGDLDGDGKSDVAISNSSIGTLSVYNNTSTPGTISFGSGASVAAASTFGRLAIGDLDGDGKSDLVVSGSSGGDFLSVLQNSSFPGTLRFEPKIGFSTGVGGTNPYSVAIGDLDGDNKPDLAVSNIFGSSVTVLRNTTSIVGLISTTSFAFRQVVSIGTFPVGLAIGDLDGDGRPDMALTGGSAGLQVLRNNPSTIVSFNANGGSGSMTDQIIALDVPASLTSNAFTRSGYSFGGWNTSADGSGIVYNNATIYAASTATATLYAQWVQAPTITAFSPAIGNPGTLVTLSGTNLALPTAVNIGGVPAIVVSKTNTSLVAMVMPGATSGSILVSNGAGTGSASGSFTVTATPYPVAQQGGKLVGTGSTGVSSQGQSVAVSADGNTAIVGGLSDNNGAGAARVYTRSGGIWTQQGPKLVGTGAVGNANQGRSVSLSADGNTAIVGGIADNGYVGAAWVFTRSGGIWTQQGPKLVGTGAVGTSFQGSDLSLSADGNTITTLLVPPGYLPEVAAPGHNKVVNWWASVITVPRQKQWVLL
jgi:uncharacterized repeat protein (TIGR02543 family)